ncbi:MAG: nucleotide pyrophosphohydrolase [Planctomycetes bacterium]|nr:nucleotide pyrophosphohydrolase [Planctomycetota bacterium]
MPEKNNTDPDRGGWQSLQESVLSFAKEREWESYHTPKNLASALIVEAAELLEHFQWLTPEESLNLSKEKKAEVAEELADVLTYLIRMSQQLDVDLLDETFQKLSKNATKYPVEKFRGKWEKVRKGEGTRIPNP